MGGIGGTLINCLYRDVMSGKSIIDTPYPFVEYVDKAVKGITSLYLSVEDILIAPDDIEASLRIKDTLQIPMIKWLPDKQNVPYLLTCSFTKWLPTKSFPSHNFMGKELEVIKKLRLMITIVAHVLETMNQPKNGFSAQDVRFSSIATASLINNRRWN